MRGARRAAACLLGAWVATAAVAQAPPAAGTPAAAQAAPSDRSAMRTLLETRGIVVVARRSPLAPVALHDRGSLRVSALGAFEPGMEEHRILGIEIALNAPGLSPEQGRHYLDVHEIEALLQGLFLLEQVGSAPKPGFESAADYTTVEGFTVGVDVDARGSRFWVEGGRGKRVRLGIDPARIETLRQRLQEARAKLFSR